MKEYKSYRVIDGKTKWVVVDENGKIVNINPNKDKLREIEKEIRNPQDTRKKFTNEKLLEELSRFNVENGRIPCEADFTNNPNYPSFGTYKNYFGSWNSALELVFGNNINTTYTDEELLEILIQYTIEKGRPPKIKDFSDYCQYPCFSTYQLRFGSWYNAINKAGLLEKRDWGNIPSGNICYKCGTEAKRRETDKEGNWTGKYLCKKDYERHNSNSNNSIIKSMRNRRLGNLKDPYNILGDNCEELTSRWLGVKRLSIELDSFSRIPLDHTPIPNGTIIEIGTKLVDLSGKILQTRGSNYRTSGYWKSGGTLELDWFKEFDYMVLYCISKDGTYVESIYTIPKEEIFNLETGESRTAITITNIGNPKTWYEKYRVTNEETLRKVSEIWKQILEGQI